VAAVSVYLLLCQTWSSISSPAMLHMPLQLVFMLLKLPLQQVTPAIPSKSPLVLIEHHVCLLVVS
jgi:hypothetical protein